jgi:hypothetical protein
VTITAITEITIAGEGRFIPTFILFPPLSDYRLQL